MVPRVRETFRLRDGGFPRLFRGNATVIRGRHHRGMVNDFIAPAASAAAVARDRLEALGAKPAADERAAARFAQHALFAEALLDALRARFAELRTVAK